MLSLAATSVYLADPPRGPDSHDLRRERGDVLMVDGRPEAAAAPLVHDGRYEPPYPGWKYVPLRSGQRLSPAFLGARYTIARPRNLGIASPEPDRRWIRYGDDAVLVEADCGRVIEVDIDRFR